jgi:hypothetical protein
LADHGREDEYLVIHIDFNKAFNLLNLFMPLGIHLGELLFNPLSRYSESYEGPFVSVFVLDYVADWRHLGISRWLFLHNRLVDDVLWHGDELKFLDYLLKLFV